MDDQKELAVSKQEHIQMVEKIKDDLWKKLNELLDKDSGTDFEIAQDFLIKELGDPIVIVQLDIADAVFYTYMSLSKLNDYMNKIVVSKFIISVKSKLNDGFFYMMNIHFYIEDYNIYAEKIEAAI